jgi:hypothetical protein
LRERSKDGQNACAIDSCATDAYSAAVTALQTIVELPEFLRRAKAIMTDDERVALVDYIAANPEADAALVATYGNRR